MGTQSEGAHYRGWCAEPVSHCFDEQTRFATRQLTPPARYLAWVTFWVLSRRRIVAGSDRVAREDVARRTRTGTLALDRCDVSDERTHRGSCHVPRYCGHDSPSSVIRKRGRRGEPVCRSDPRRHHPGSILRTPVSEDDQEKTASRQSCVPTSSRSIGASECSYRRKAQFMG
jgi:hypothetical protein